VLLIFTPKSSNRLIYTFELIFTELLGIEYKLSDDEEHFEDFIGPKFNYSHQYVEKNFFIYANPLLFEKGVHPQDIEHTHFRDETVPFATHHPKSEFPFDLFAASFYLITRYEEYLPFEADKHGRFPAKSSLASLLGFLEKPVINIWAKSLLEKLHEYYPLLESNPKFKYNFIPTYDIDIAYSYKYKGLYRNIAAAVLDIKRLDFARVGERLKVLLGKELDPYDTFDYLEKLEKEYNLKSIYFFPVGSYSKYDKNISTSRKPYRDLIQNTGDFSEIGIHPSYISNENESLLEAEITTLEQITKRSIARSRQHYVKLKFPDTYERLIDKGINKDYSMGYPDALGFRASVASSFFFYDLSQETTTQLRVYPFVMMDVTFKNYHQFNEKETLQKIRQIIREVHRVEGMLITVWHNNTLSETDGWEGWRSIYENMLEWATNQ